MFLLMVAFLLAACAAAAPQHAENHQLRGTTHVLQGFSPVDLFQESNHRMLQTCGPLQADVVLPDLTPGATLPPGFPTESGCVILCAGNDCEDAGEVCITTDGPDLVVDVTTDGGWTIKDVAIDIVALLTDFHTNNGGIVVGHFDYKSGDLLAGTTTHTYTQDLSAEDPVDHHNLGICCPFFDDAGDPIVSITIYVAVHVNVFLPGSTTEHMTAWPYGHEHDGANWAMYFQVVLTCPGEEPPNSTTPPAQVCETAFASAGRQEDGTCFLDMEPAFDRWGWSLSPNLEETMEYQIYAGAAQCDTGNGTPVGTLTVSYDSDQGDATIIYAMTSPYLMYETHLYVGNALVPSSKKGLTVAPGQYGRQSSSETGVESETYVVNIAPPVYIIAHAVVCSTSSTRTIAYDAYP